MSAKGTIFENAVEADMAARGWVAKRLASTSGGDAGDVWAATTSELAFIECKSGRRGECRPAQWNRLYRAAMAAGAVPVLARRRYGRLNPGQARITYQRILGEKTGSLGMREPCEPWDPGDHGRTDA